MQGRFSIDTGMRQPIQARRFMQLVGPKIFGAAWSETDIRSSLDAEAKTLLGTLFIGDSDNPAHRRFFVQGRILDALAAEEIIADVAIRKPDWTKICADAWIHDPDFATYFSGLSSENWGDRNAQQIAVRKLGRERRPIVTTDEDDDFDDDVSNDTEFDRILDQVRPYFEAVKSLENYSVTATVAAAYWAELITSDSGDLLGDRLDWVSSRLKVSSKDLDFVYTPPSAGGASHLIVRKAPTMPIEAKQSKAAALQKMALNAVEGFLDKTQKHYLFLIQNPSDAVMKVSQQPHFIEKTGWGQQFMERERFYWPLVIAATWRVIAFKLKKKQISLTGNYPERGIQVDIRKKLDAYLQLQTVDTPESPSESSLKKIVSAVCDQLYGEEEEANIFFNLTDADVMMKREKTATAKE